MKTSIHQPSLFPWLGLLDKIAKSELFVFLDDVHANKASYQYRNIFYCNGEAKFLTLPVNYRLDIKLNELEFKNGSWRIDHLNKLKNYYEKAPYFDEIYPLIEDLYLKSYSEIKPIDFIIDSMRLCFKLYNININTVRSSSLDYSGQKGDLVLDICKLTGTTTYLSGKGAERYMNTDVLDNFKSANIEIEWNSFSHPDYIQDLHYPFLSGLSSLDLLFFNGIERSRNVFFNNL